MKYRNRIVWLDWAKSISMILVVFGHCHLSTPLITQFIYSFHIPLFFFLSGFLCHNDFSKKKFVDDINNLLIPYLFYGIIFVFFTSLVSHSLSYQHLEKEIIKLCLGTDSSIGPIWFLPALFICKQLFLIINLIKKYNILYYILILTTFISPLAIHYYKLNTFFFSDSALFGLPFFYMGNLSSIVIIHKIASFKKGTLLVYSLLFFCFTICLSYLNDFVSIAECIYGTSIFIYYINAITGILAIICICIYINKSNKFIFITSYGTIVTLGLHSYFFWIFNYYLPKLIHLDLMIYPVYTGLIYTTIIYASCYHLIILIDKYLPKPFGLKGNLASFIETSKS